MLRARPLWKRAESRALSAPPVLGSGETWHVGRAYCPVGHCSRPTLLRRQTRVDVSAKKKCFEVLIGF